MLALCNVRHKLFKQRLTKSDSFRIQKHIMDVKCLYSLQSTSITKFYPQVMTSHNHCKQSPQSSLLIS